MKDTPNEENQTVILTQTKEKEEQSFGNIAEKVVQHHRSSTDMSMSEKKGRDNFAMLLEERESAQNRLKSKTPS